MTDFNPFTVGDQVYYRGHVTATGRVVAIDSDREQLQIEWDDNRLRFWYESAELLHCPPLSEQEILDEEARLG